MYRIWPCPENSLGGCDPPARPPCPSCARLGDHRGSGMKAAVTLGGHSASPLSAQGCSAPPPTGVPREYKSTLTPSLHFLCCGPMLCTKTAPTTGALTRVKHIILLLWMYSLKTRMAALVFPPLYTQLKTWITWATGVQITTFANDMCDRALTAF